MIVSRKFRYFMMILLMTLGLGLVLSSIETAPTDVTQYHQQTQTFLSSMDKFHLDTGVFTVINHATKFNHPHQVNVDYVWAFILALFIIPTVNYRHFRSSLVSLPWFVLIRRRSRLFISGGRISNLRYKFRTQHQHKR